MNSNNEFISTLEDLIAIESVSTAGTPDTPYGEGPARALEYVLSVCDSFGFKTKNCAGRVGYAEIGSGDRLVGILVHLDTVPEGDGWIHPAFGCEIVDGKIFGRGIVDDKGPAVACIYAMKDLLDSGCALNSRIRIIFGLTEEVGEWTDLEYYCQTEEIPTLGFTPDADFPAIHGEKGIAMLELTMPLEKAGVRKIYGGSAPNVVADKCYAAIPSFNSYEYQFDTSGKAAHGSMPEKGENAISKIMQDIHELNEEKLANCPLAEFYIDKIGFDLYGEKMGCALSDEKSGRLTLNVGLIRTDEDSVTLTLDIRYPVTYTLADVLSRIESSVSEYGVTVSVYEETPPVYMDIDCPLIETLVSVYRDVTSDNSLPPVIGGGTYARAMDNIVAFGPTFPGRESTEHRRNEYMYLEDLFKIREIYRRAIERLANQNY